jgi:hypothetical protein
MNLGVTKIAAAAALAAAECFFFTPCLLLSAA